MLFNSLDYAVFLIGVLAVYFVLPRRGQNGFLLAASYLFYGAWDYRFLGLILLSTVIDFGVGLALAGTRDPKLRRRWLLLSIFGNLGILGTFKYLGFFAESLADLGALLGVEVPRLVFDVALPVGISFYTFQTLSYTIDVYRERLEPTRSFFDFALFVAFFPQLVAGPIERAINLLPQIRKPRTPTLEGFGSGCWLILWGLFKKVVIADNLALLVAAVYDGGSSPTNLELLFATYAFFFQLYCDFSGYTDIARGTARLLGFELVVNFNRPLFATSIVDFWNRWHISLGSWIRDYVYIPLGGSRRGLPRTCINLFVMFLLVGLWHGASWNFVLWGAYNGLMLVVHRLARPLLRRIQPVSSKGRIGWRAVRILAVLQLNCFALLLFRVPSASQVGDLVALLGGPLDPGLTPAWLIPSAVLLAPLLVIETWQELTGDAEVVEHSPLVVRTLIYAILLAGIILLGEQGAAAFIYFRF